MKDSQINLLTAIIIFLLMFAANAATMHYWENREEKKMVAGA